MALRVGLAAGRARLWMQRGSDGGGGGGGAALIECNGTSAASRACCDVGQALADACVRCGVASAERCAEEVENAIERESLGRGCEGADSIRDEDAFYGECLPAFETLSCDELVAATLPASCTDQIRYRL